MARRNPRCILFVEASRNFPGEVSLRAKKDGYLKADEVRHALTRAGFEPGDRVIVMLDPTPTEPRP